MQEIAERDQYFSESGIRAIHSPGETGEKEKVLFAYTERGAKKGLCYDREIVKLCLPTPSTLATHTHAVGLSCLPILALITFIIIITQDYLSTTE